MSKPIAPASFYPADDLPVYLEEIRQKQAPKPREPRTDLQKGQIVIILEGEHAGVRCVFLESKECVATVTGPKEINGVSFLEIDERYLLPTSYVFDIKNVDSKDCERVLMQKIEGEKYMKRYLKSAFTVPENEDIYKMKL